MNQITIMDAQLSNMIAAGEVVERPASAVKELVENAVDAGASKIEVHLQDSGIRQIKVIDNGSGMSAADAKLAFLRHATSKIKTTHDIMRISTLGFRGEALPSIAAVSDVRLKTSDGSSEGYFIHIKGGEILKEEPFAVRKGTEIEVNHLFFNTPARLKHIKSLNTELSHVTDYLTKTALAHPNIGITVTNNNKEVFKTPGHTTIQTVIARIYGFDIGKKMHSFSGGNDDFKIEGLVSEPEVTRASRNYITLIVNNRPIKNYELVRTVVEGYHTFLPKDRYPIVVINIAIDPLLVDVNVHPAKIEVRFSKEEALKSFILTEVKKALTMMTYVPAPTMMKAAPLVKNPTYVQPTLQSASVNKQSLAPYTQSSEQKAPLRVQEVAKSTYEARSVSASDGDVHSRTMATEEVMASEVTPEVAVVPKKEVVIEIPQAKVPALELFYIGQLHGTYLLAQNPEGLFLIDQHAAMERVEYEKNYPLLGSVGAENMTLLVPITLSYPVAELVRVKEKLPQLLDFGFDVEEFGATDLVVRACPVWASKDVLPIVETIISTLLSGREVSIAKLREAVSIMMSCKKSIKANQYINEAEVRGLLEQLCVCEQPYTCPHGRPIIVKLTTYEIERLFKRA